MLNDYIEMPFLVIQINFRVFIYASSVCVLCFRPVAVIDGSENEMSLLIYLALLRRKVCDLYYSYLLLMLFVITLICLNFPLGQYNKCISG